MSVPRQRRAIVTGGARGIGKAIAALLPFFFFPAPAACPENFSSVVKKLEGITLIATRDSEDISLGLQYVAEMPENFGVLFRDLGRVNAFHCRNCLFTIEMTALAGNGKVLQIVNVPPETGAVKMPEGTKYVIETNAGVMRKKGFRVGDRIELASLKKSVDPSLNIIDNLPRIQVSSVPASACEFSEKH